MIITDVVEYLESFAPLDLAESWDNVGLLLGSPESPVSRIRTCLTVTPDVVEACVAESIDLIVSHHPMMFRPVQQVTSRSVEGQMLRMLIQSDIALYSPHTAFDSCKAGINQGLAEAFGLSSVHSLKPLMVGDGPGSGRWGELRNPVPLVSFLSLVQNAVNAEYLEVTRSSDDLVRRVGIACGAADGFLEDALAVGCDTFVTGEARFHTALRARSVGVNLILTGHFNSERHAVQRLADTMTLQFPDLDISAVRETDPLQVFPSVSPERQT